MGRPDPEVLGVTAIKPPGWDRTGFEAFKYFVFNPSTCEILSRTPLSWLKIIIFYIIYYSCLAGFWLGCLTIFSLTLPEPSMGPKYTMRNSLIGSNPGLGLLPKNPDIRIDSQMFIINGHEGYMKGYMADFNNKYAYSMTHFLAYQDQPSRVADPHFDSTTLRDERGDCSLYPYGYLAEPNGYNSYDSPSPCIFLKLNKIWGWDPYSLGGTIAEDGRYTDDYWDHPDKFPAVVLEKYHELPDKHDIIVNCEGRYSADKEALTNIKYFPKSQSIPAKFFPFKKGGDTPLVAVKIELSPEHVGQLVHVECRAYYYGVEHSSKDRIGLVQFELLITE